MPPSDGKPRGVKPILRWDTQKQWQGFDRQAVCAAHRHARIGARILPAEGITPIVFRIPSHVRTATFVLVRPREKQRTLEMLCVGIGDKRPHEFQKMLMSRAAHRSESGIVDGCFLALGDDRFIAPESGSKVDPHARIDVGINCVCRPDRLFGVLAKYVGGYVQVVAQLKGRMIDHGFQFPVERFNECCLLFESSIKHENWSPCAFMFGPFHPALGDRFQLVGDAECAESGKESKRVSAVESVEHQFVRTLITHAKAAFVGVLFGVLSFWS
ncbi:MAG: hypothetical protein IID45_11480 [Planctomycetes bacterium]|nr:hypothetical protein [Planctomycetota bacterium]